VSFKLQPSPTFWATVPVRLPGGELADLQLEFRHRSVSQMAALFDGAAGRSDADVVADVVAGWRDVDEAFSPEAVRTLVDNHHGIAGLIVEAYYRELVQAKRGN
jgi:hypothetical protein